MTTSRFAPGRSMPTAARSTGPVTLDLHPLSQFGVEKLSGTASGWYFAPTPVVLIRTESITKANPTPDAGLYNIGLTLSGTGNDPQTQLGTGTILVNKNGKTKLVAKLIDGIQVVSTGNLSEDDSWPFYNTLYSNHGSLGGTVYFDQASSTCTGTLYWFKPTTKSKTYPAAISTQITLTGTRQ